MSERMVDHTCHLLILVTRHTYRFQCGRGYLCMAVCDRCNFERQPANDDEYEQVEECWRAGRQLFKSQRLHSISITVLPTISLPSGVFFAEVVDSERVNSTTRHTRTELGPYGYGYRYAQLWTIDSRHYVLVAMPPVRKPGDGVVLSLGEEFAVGSLIDECRSDYIRE